MAGVINRAVAAKGVIAFQDRQVPDQFVYFPGSGQAVLGDTLEAFSCRYYGIGPKPQFVQVGPGKYLDLAGGIVGGKMRFDASDEQKDALRKEIQRIFDIDAELVPAILKDTKAVPVFAQGVADLGGASKYTFPTSVAVGSSFNFMIDSGNSLFPQLIASLDVGDNPPVSPTIGINISGGLEVYGEPFEARLRADLKQVYEYVRDQVNVDAKLGWFNLSSSYDKIAQSLVKENVIQIDFVQGRADSTFGLQLLESTKKVFEAINAQITSGEGMFRFLPNPDPQEPKDPEKSWFADLAPWSVGLNMSFIRNTFKQSISFDERVKFEGLYTIPVTSSINLGVVCGPQTKDMFYDVTEAENGCITPKKAEALQKRIAKERGAKTKKILEYMQKYEDDKITRTKYEDLVAMLNTLMLTEQDERDTRDVEDLLRRAEERAGARIPGRTHADSNGALVGNWHVFEVGEKIGDHPGATKTVEFRNLTSARGGRYGLKIGDAAQENYELGPHDRRTHEIHRHAWNAVNNGKIDIDYRRDNSAAMVEEPALAGAAS